MNAVCEAAAQEATARECEVVDTGYMPEDEHNFAALDIALARPEVPLPDD